MKKFAVLLFAAAAAVAFGAETLDVNGSFNVTKPGAKLPDGWLWNDGPKPVGKYEVVQADGKNAVKITAEKSLNAVLFNKLIPVVPGEKYELSVTAAGTTGKGGGANVGAHLWSEKGKYLRGDYAKSVKLTGQPVTIKRVITIPEAVEVKQKDGSVEGVVPKNIRVLFFIQSPGEAVFSNFSAKKLD